MRIDNTWRSEAFSVDNGWSSLLILCLGDPHGLEGREGTEDRTSDPDEEFSLSRGNNLDFHGWGSQSSDFFAESLGNSGVHSCSTTHNDVAIEIFSNVNIALKDRLIRNFVESGHFLSDKHGLEKSFRASESLAANSDGLTVGKFVNLVVLGWIIVCWILQ